LRFYKRYNANGPSACQNEIPFQTKAKLFLTILIFRCQTSCWARYSWLGFFSDTIRFVRFYILIW